MTITTMIRPIMIMSSGVAHPLSVDVDIGTDNSYLIPSVIRVVERYSVYLHV